MKWTSRDGVSIDIRPIRPDDEAKMVRFHQSLSERSVYLRYFHHMLLSTRVTHERLTHICFADFDTEIVLAAESLEGEIIAVGRLTRDAGSPEAEFALLVSDAWHSHGLGTELLHTLVSLAGEKGIHRVFGDILTENQPMQDICRQLGFELHYSVEERVVKASIAVPKLGS